MSNKAEKTVAVRLSTEQNQQLEKLAHKHKTTVSDFLRGLLDEKVRTPTEELEALRQEEERLQAEIQTIEETEEQKRQQEAETQRLEALQELENELRSKLPSLFELRHRTFTEFANNAYGTLNEIAIQYDGLIQNLEASDVEVGALREKHANLGGNFESLWAEAEATIEKIELEEGVQKLLNTIDGQRASWVQYNDSVLRFLDTRLATSSL